jgi:rRNA maturation endonuclease Nob1
MALFRRKAIVEDEPERCPVCRERLPDDVDECAMCGADLRPLLGKRRHDQHRSRGVVDHAIGNAAEEH